MITINENSGRYIITTRDVVIEKAGFMTKSERDIYLFENWYMKGRTDFDMVKDVREFNGIRFDTVSYYRLKKLGWFDTTTY